MKQNLKLFLDLDGVMIPTISIEPNTFSKESASVINKLCDDYNVIIICISTRITKMSVEEIKKLFNDNGIFCEIQVAPLTEPFDKIKSIEEYYKSNLMDCQFLIIDDTTRMFSIRSMFDNNFRYVTGFRGLTDGDAYLDEVFIAWEDYIYDDGPKESLAIRLYNTVQLEIQVSNGKRLVAIITRPDLLEQYYNGEISVFDLCYNSHTYLLANVSSDYISPEEFSLKYLYLKRAKWFLDFKPEILPHAIALLNPGINPDMY